MTESTTKKSKTAKEIRKQQFFLNYLQTSFRSFIHYSTNNNTLEDGID